MKRRHSRRAVDGENEFNFERHLCTILVFHSHVADTRMKAKHSTIIVIQNKE